MRDDHAKADAQYVTDPRYAAGQASPPSFKHAPEGRRGGYKEGGLGKSSDIKFSFSKVGVGEVGLNFELLLRPFCYAPQSALQHVAHLTICS